MESPHPEAQPTHRTSQPSCSKPQKYILCLSPWCIPWDEDVRALLQSGSITDSPVDVLLPPLHPLLLCGMIMVI